MQGFTGIKVAISQGIDSLQPRMITYTGTGKIDHDIIVGLARIKLLKE